MPTSRLQQAIAKFRAELLAQEAATMRTLDAAHQRILRMLEPELNKLYDAMVEQMANGEKIPASWLHEANRLEAIKKLISRDIDQFALLSQQQVGALKHVAAQLGTRAAVEYLEILKPASVAWTFGLPNPKAINDLIATTQAGSPLADLFNGFGQEAAEKAANALLRGVTLGKNPREIAPDVQEELSISRNRALTIARQESLRCYKNSNTETYRANSDTVESWRWTCSLSSRTCSACLAMDGTIHDLSEDLESHVCCRCAPIPVTRSWEDILSDAGIDTSVLDDIPDKRPSLPTGEDWLNAQPVAVQKQVMGPRYAGWKNGDFSLNDTVQHSHDPTWGRSIGVKPVKALVKK